MTDQPSHLFVICREVIAGEKRVAGTPESVKALVGHGLAVGVQPGAGLGAGITDDEYIAAGAKIVEDLTGADIVAHVRPLTGDQIAQLKPGTLTVGFATADLDSVKACQEAGVTSLAMELVPRISRAQSMDALTSQALVSGYRCVLEAAMRLPRFFPLFMTAAGTVPPAKVLVLGAGVAGLQAIATAKRLGAQVSANDIRAASAEEVRSMGGTFIDLELEEKADAAGGYAKQLSEDSATRQQELLTPHLAKADVVITTAGVPGKKAPRLVTAKMLDAMKPGSVVIDLLAENGGNVEGSIPGEDTKHGEVTIYGMKDPASTMAVDASRLYAKNISNLLALGLEDGRFTLDMDDEVFAGCCLIFDKSIRHEPTRQALEGAK